MRELVMTAAIEDVADPEAGDYGARVDMVACGICSSTDRMLRTGTFCRRTSLQAMATGAMPWQKVITHRLTAAEVWQL